MNTSIEFKLEFDTDRRKDWEEVVFGSGHYNNGWFQMDYKEENSWSRIGKKEEILKQIEEPTHLFVEFTRRMTAEDVSRWKAKRNTGMRLSWSYDDPQLEPDHKYRELANILHSQNNKEQLWREIKILRNEKLMNISNIYLF